jgi:chaperonin cofactor prefoldin
MEAEVAEIKRIENGKYLSHSNPVGGWLSFEMIVEFKKVVINKQKMAEKKSENEMVMAEFKMLDDDANVFKMVGPILAKQSLFECKDLVQQRINFITKEVARYETLETEF